MTVHYTLSPNTSDPVVMDLYKDNWNNDAHKPQQSLRVVIVGAGIAGLATGIGTHTYQHSAVYVF